MKKLKKIKNACAPAALCHASGGIDEETVLRICRSSGFKEAEGMATEEWQEAAHDLGIRFRSIPIDPCILKIGRAHV